MTLQQNTLWADTKVEDMDKALKQLDLHELEVLSIRIEDNLEATARLLFPDHPQNRSQLTELIHTWAIHRKLVLESAAGDMPHIAHVFEKAAQRIWQRLPDYARVVRVKID